MASCLKMSSEKHIWTVKDTISTQYGTYREVSMCLHLSSEMGTVLVHLEDTQ